MKFDQVLEEHVGSCRRYQILLVVFLSLGGLYSGLFTTEIVFAAAKMAHWCDVPRPLEAVNLTQEEWLNKTVPWVYTRGQWNRDGCKAYVGEFTGLVDMDENKTMAPTINISTCSTFKYDTSIFKSTIVNEWNLICSKKYTTSFIKSAILAAKGIGGILYGFASDGFGRRRTLIGSYLLMCVARVGVIFSYNLPIYVVSISITVFSQVFTYGTAFTLSMELVGRRWRSAVGALVAEMFAVAYILLAGMAYLFRYRQTLHVVVSLTLITYIPIIWLVPESPRWLVDTGRHQEAVTVLGVMARRNGTSLPDDVEIDTLEKLDDKESKASTSTLKILKQIFTTPILLGRVSVITLAWFTANMAYYGLTMNIQSFAGSLYLNLAIAGTLEFISAFLGQLVINTRFGRRRPTCLLYVMSGLSLLLVLAVPSDKRIIATVLAVFGRTCCSAYFTIIYIWTAETYPTTMRTVSISLCSAVGKIGGVLAPFLAELDSVSEVLPMMILGGISLASGLLLLLIPETKGVPLPRTVDDMLNNNRKKAKDSSTIFPRTNTAKSPLDKSIPHA